MKNILTLIVCLLCVPIHLLADELHFSQISSRNGLSQNTVRAIVEDKNGFIWAGTLDGLNRYDGYNIRSYQPQIGNPNSLGDHRIRDLFVDRDGFLWAMTVRGELGCYDPVADIVYKEDRNGQLFTYSSYYESTQGDIWLWGKYDGVGRVKKEGIPPFTLEKLIPRADDKKALLFLFEDSQQTIWVGGDSGLRKIDKQYVLSEPLTATSGYTFTKAVEYKGKVYFTTLQSVLVVYDMTGKRFEEIKLAPKEAFTNIINFADNELLLLTQSLQLWVYHTETKQFRLSEISGDSAFSTELRCFVDKNNGLWLYGRSGTVWYYNQQKRMFKQISLIPPGIARMMDIGKIIVDSDNLVWIMTYGYGLFCYNPLTEKLTHYHNESIPNKLPSNYLLSMTEDHAGNLWVGSEYAGMIRIVKTPGYIRIVRPEPVTIIGRTNNVRAIYEDSNKNIWVGAKNGSLYVYDAGLTNGRCVAENINPYSLIEDDKHRLWVGTKGDGICLFNINSFRMEAQYKYQPDNPSSLSNNVIFHLMKDRNNRIWAASFSGGINLAVEQGGTFTFKRFVQDEGERSYVRYLYQDSQGMIWAGSSDGLMKFDPDKLIQSPADYITYKKDANAKNSLSSNDIKVVYEDREHTLWIGTAGGGLNKYVPATQKEPEHFEAYTMTQGMADNYVLGILEHGDCLWLSSEKGLSSFRKKDGAVATYQFAQRSFGNVFNEGAFCQLSNGTMLWGNLDGLLAFNPETFVPDSGVPPVLFTGLTVDGADWNTLRSPADKSITYTNKIKLTYQQNTFTLEFATMNLRNPEENKYTYILENYDKSWSAPAHSNTAVYKNLPPGKYIFKVKGANSDGVWNEAVTSLEIVITPPFWKSTIAYIIYVLLVGLLLYIAFRLIMKFNRLNNAVEVEKQLTNHKLRFFTNISHEFRTPLTLIQGAVENIKEEPELPASVGKQINILNRNAVNLRRLIDQLLEFRKLQNDVLKLDLEELDMVAFVHDIFVGFQDMAARKGIEYNFNTRLETFPMFIDRKKIDKVVYNLLSNAFKFTPKGGYIELSLVLHKEEQTCVVSVKDSGIGIPKEKQHLLFSRFTQINFSTSGTGVGLSLVKEFVDVHKGKVRYEGNPEGGSVFVVELPASKEVYKGENFIPSGSDVILETFSPVAVIDEPASEEDTPPVDRETLATYQLLIIDDNDDIRNFLADKFRTYLNVDTASDGKEGLQKAIETNPDLIICDVMMPEMDGFEVTRQLKGEFQTCHIPIILLTAHSSIEHQLEGIESGADAYITKPFSLKFVEKRVMKLIEQRERLKSRFSKEFVIDGSLVQTTDRDKAFFDKIETILDKNYADSTFTVDRFVELSGIRRTIFFKKVKGVTGFSPNELIKIRRLKESAVLLRQSELTVSEISYKVGFEDPFYYSKCFKAYFNCTPSKYRNGEDEAGD